MTIATLPPPLSSAPTVHELAALRDALTTWQATTSATPLPPTPTIVRPASDVSLLGQLLAGLVSMEQYQDVAGVVVGPERAPVPAPVLAPVSAAPVVPRLELVPTASFSAGRGHTSFVDAIVAFLRWLLGR